MYSHNIFLCTTYSLILQMEAAYASEILLPAYQNNQCRILERSPWLSKYDEFTTHISSCVCFTDSFLSFFLSSRYISVHVWKLLITQISTDSALLKSLFLSSHISLFIKVCGMSWFSNPSTVRYLQFEFYIYLDIGKCYCSNNLQPYKNITHK